VHTRALRDDLAAESPDACLEYLHLAHGTPVTAEEAARRRAEVRAEYGIPADAVVFGCFGGLTPEKRLPQILDAFSTIRHALPPSILLFGGEPPPHYDLRADVAGRGLDDQVIVTGYVETDHALTSLIASSDVTLNLRWPTARELSGPWLRSLAAGRCSIVSALNHLAGIPVIRAGSWTAAAAGPIAVAVDLIDERDELPRAMRRLAHDPALRDQIGADARHYWQREHSYDLMLDDYRRLIPLAASLPAPRPPGRPRHLVPDPSSLTARLLAPLGVPVPWSSM
jgi:glycosyltransferase involved in cell wall biosynthesis